MPTAFLIVILIFSLLLFWYGTSNVVTIFLRMFCFWGEVAWDKPTRIKYVFNLTYGLISFVIGFVGVLYSVIALAIRS